MTRHNEAGERYRFMPPFSIMAILLYLLYSPCHTLQKSHAPLDFLRSKRDAALIRIANAALSHDTRKNAFGRKSPLAGKQVFYLWAIFAGMSNTRL